MTERQVKDCFIEYVIRTLRERLQCEVKHNRTDLDFVEYAKWVPIKKLSEMVVEYFSSENEHYFELKRKVDELKKQIQNMEEVQS